MAEEKGFGSTLALVTGGVILLGLVNSAFSGDPKPAPSPSPTRVMPRGQPQPPPDGFMLARAEREVRGLLKDPDSAVFGEMYVRRAPALVVCGTVNSRNSFGGMAGRQRFISGSVTSLEEQMRAGEMDKVWGRVC